MKATRHISRTLAAAAVAAIAWFGACSSDDAPMAPPQTIDLTTGLSGRYSFEGDVNDASGNGQDGTLIGGATANGFLQVGSNDTDVLSLPASLLNGLGDFTIAGWVRMDTFHIWPSQWISGATAAEDNSIGIWYDPNNNRWSMCFSDVSYNFDNNNVMEDLMWHHIVITRSGSKAALYVDGVAMTTGLDVDGSPLAVDNGGFMVGQDQDSLGGGFQTDNSLAGSVDELRIYNRALGAAAVAELHKLGR